MLAHLTRWILALMLILPMACRSSRSLPEAIPADFVLTFTRTACLGQCPAYFFRVDASGLVLYEGAVAVPHIGRYQKQLPPGRVVALVTALREADFFAFAPAYDDPQVMDLPAVILELTLDGQQHRVLSRLDPPARLLRLQEEIEAIVGKEGYVPFEK